tara:strand:- start:381 stop:602 length:222 start_codon:yes stop_codon:yes gene_type:complete
MQKIFNILSAISFLLTLGICGTGFFGYKYVTSEQFKNKMINQVMGGVTKALPTQIDKQMPDVTGKSIPIPLKK